MGLRRSSWGNAALAVLAPAVFLGLLELVLLVAGIKPLSLTEDPMVGFASLQPLYAPVPGEEGMVATHPAKLTHFNPQRFPLRKPPGAYRIFAVGGSTTYGHPWRDPVSYAGWLRALLPAADPSRTWEVINAGGISYASYREAKLVEEIAAYDPDLILVYSGHNEFLEERTYRKAAGIPSWVRETSALLDRTRTYTVMRRALRSARGDASPGGGDASGSAARPRLASEVDDVLARTIGPTSYTRDDTLRRDVLDHYRASLVRIARLAQDAGGEVLFLTTPGNERDCSPFKSEPTPGLAPEPATVRDALLRRADALESAGDTAGAWPVLDSAARLDPRNAAVLYRAGKAALAAGRHAEAKRLLVRALDEDVCPLRALPAMRDIVHEAARETGSGVLDVVADLEARTRERFGHDILGEPHFVDHVHLALEEYRAIALGVIRHLEARGVVKPAPGWGEPAIAQVTGKVMAGRGSRERGEGLHNIAKVLNWAGKHEDAARIAAQGLAVDSTGLEAIWSSLFVGAALERQGRSQEALPHYQRAMRLDSANPMVRQYLMDALERAGRAGEAAPAAGGPDDAEARARAASALLQEGKAAEALPHLEAAVRTAPGNAVFHVLLGDAQRRSGRARDAERSYSRALELDPKEGRALLGLARLADAAGNRPEAINLYARALTVTPDLHEAREALSRALQGMPASP